MKRIFLVLLMLSAKMKHSLNLQYIAAASICAGLNNESQVVSELLAGKYGCSSDCCVSLILLPEEEKAKAESEYSGEGVLLEVFLLLFHECLQNGLSCIFVACADINETNGQGCH